MRTQTRSWGLRFYLQDNINVFKQNPDRFDKPNTTTTMFVGFFHSSYNGFYFLYLFKRFMLENFLFLFLRISCFSSGFHDSGFHAWKIKKVEILSFLSLWQFYFLANWEEKIKNLVGRFFLAKISWFLLLGNCRYGIIFYILKIKICTS